MIIATKSHGQSISVIGSDLLRAVPIQYGKEIDVREHLSMDIASEASHPAVEPPGAMMVVCAPTGAASIATRAI